jgi:GGDEF domain-containing protein
VPDADAETLQTILQRIRTAVDAHNASAAELKVCYAVGCAASADYPGMSRRHLFRLADEKMYIDKNK